MSPIDAASINALEKYGFYIDDKDTTVTILFANNKNYIATAFHKRADKGFYVEGQGGIRGVERSINRAPDDKGNKRLRIARAPGEIKGFFVDSKNSGKLFVVKGLIKSKYPDKRNFINIKSDILNGSQK